MSQKEPKHFPLTSPGQPDRKEEPVKIPLPPIKKD